MNAKIAIETGGAAMFLSWLESGDEGLLAAVMRHPGYLVVAQHSHTWSSPITLQNVRDAVAGHSSPVYGLARVRENVSAIREAIGYVQANREDIVNLVNSSLLRLFAPEFAYPVEMHCIVGYDWGIGLNGRVAINLNSRLYLDDHREIGYMLVHEATHVAYERVHGPMSPEWMRQPGGLRRLACTLVQNEGLAVYSPLKARIEGKCLDNRDYRLLLDPAELQESTRALRSLLAGLPDEYPGEDAVGQVFHRLSGERLSYVGGCSAFVELEKQGGLPLVREAIRWDPEAFVARAITSLPGTPV